MIFDEIDGVLFDMDGTLVDSEQHTVGAMQAVLEEHHAGPLTLRAEAVYGVSWGAISDLLKAAHPELSDESITDSLILNFRRLCRTHGATLVPGILDFFDWASSRFSVGLFTSNVRSEVDALLGEYTAFQRLQAIVTADDVTQAKPDPEGYLLLARTLGLQPGRCLVFEDSLAGLQAAKAAGMRTVGVTHSCPDKSIIESHSDLLISDYRSIL